MILTSKAFCTAAIFKALFMANSSDWPWITKSEKQKMFMDRYERGSIADLPFMSSIVDGIATHNAQELAEWFVKKGFPGMSMPIPPGGLGIGSVFDLLVQWVSEGKKTDLNIQGLGKYRAAEMECGPYTINGFNLKGYEYPLFSLKTKNNGWEVLLVEAEEDCEAVDLQQKAMEIIEPNRREFRKFDKLTFPCVQMEQEVNVSFLKGMSLPDQYIMDIKKMVRLRVDEKGAHAEAAVAMLMLRGFVQKVNYEITRPFYVIFTKKDLKIPPFVALCAPDSWQKV